MINTKRDYLYILLVGNNAFGIWRSGKLVGIDESSQGVHWDVDYLSSLPYADIHKHYIKQNYPNTSIVSFEDKKIASIPKLFITATKKLNEKVEDPNELIFARDYYFVQVGNESQKIETIEADKSEEEKENDKNFDYFMKNLQKASKIHLDRFGKCELNGSNLANEEKRFEEYVKRKRR